jgi:hypothetical protein
MQEIETTPAESSADSDRASNGSYSHDDGAPPAVRARADVAADPTLSPGAKFFFGWLVDNSFLRRFGGDGFGRITIGQKDIRRITHHDRKSITEWTKQLCDSRHLWIEPAIIPNAYPVNVYCIRALVPGRQQLEISGLAHAWGRARGDRGKFSSSQPAGDFSAENAHPASQGRKTPPPNGGKLHLAGGENGTGQGEKLHLAGGENGTLEAENFPMRGGKNGRGEVDNFPVSRPKNSTSEAGKADHLKETPKEERRQGDTVSVPAAATHTGIPQFEPLDLRCAPRLRPKLGEQMIDLAKEKIYAEENRRPLRANAKDVIAAYKARIKAVKKWIAGEL